MRIYISGPMTGVDNYVAHFSTAEQFLTSLGHTVMNPASVDACMPEDVSYDEFLNLDLYLMAMCDAVYLLNGWNKSNGAKVEAADAIHKKMIIFTEAEKELVPEVVE